MTYAEGLSIPVEQHIIERPRPADQEMLGAIALYGVVSENDLQAVTVRLQSSFDELRADKTQEHGACIAIAYPPLALDQEDRIDERMLEIAKLQNHGMETLVIDENISQGAVDKVWAGLDPYSGKLLRLFKRTGYILLDDHSLTTSTIWALKARKVDLTT